MPIRERPPHLGHGLRAKLAAVYRIAERDLLAQLRSRAFLIQTVLLPFVLTLIIGMALGSGKALEDVPVALVAEASALVDRLEASLTSTKVIKVIRLSDAEAREAVRNGRAVAMIHIPDGLERRLLRRTVQNDVKLIGDPARSEQFVLIEQLVRTNLTALEAGRAAVLGAVEALKPEDATQLGQALERSSQAVTTALAKSPVTFTNSTASGRAQGFFTYFAVAFGVMFTLLSATNGAGGVLDEVERGTITRLLGSPLGAPLLFFSKFLALLVIALTQLGLYMLLTTLLFSASWGTLPLVLLGLLATATAAAGFGAIVAGLAQSHEQVNVIGMVLTLGMGLLGGSIWPIETLPGPVQFLSRFTYNRWAIETFQTLAVPGFDLTDIWVAVLVLFAMGLVGLAFGAWRLSRWLKL
jgi:ABC-2 type transport system permease protein